MAKKRARRSAIVPAIVFSTAIAGGLCVTPAIVGCDANNGPPPQYPAFDVAASDFAIPYDFSHDDAELPD
jgi:hypothetical protein